MGLEGSNVLNRTGGPPQDSAPGPMALLRVSAPSLGREVAGTTRLPQGPCMGPLGHIRGFPAPAV